MPYSSDEIQAAVQKVALTRIRRNIGSLGEKQIAQTFNDVQEAALGVFLLYQTSPFYVTYLGTLRLIETVNAQIANLLQFQQALLNAGRRVLPVENITPLSNATAALFELQGAVDARAAVFNAIEKTPAFQRFSANVDVFLSQNGSAVKASGDIAQTPQEAKQTLRALLSDILETQVILQDNAQFLANALSDYTALNLPAVAAQGTVSRASQAVARLSALLTPMTPVDRLEHLRLGILDLLTSRAVIREIGSFKVPAPIFVTEGNAVAFADDDHPAVPAVVVADIFAPYEIEGSPSMSVALDGGAPTAIALPNSLYATLNGGTFEPFNFTDLAGMSITGSVADPFTITIGVNDLLVLYVFDTLVNVSTQVFCVLTPGVGRTAANIATDVNAALAGVGLGAQYEAVAGGAGNQHVVIRSKVANKGSLVRVTIGQGTANATPGLPAGTTAAGTDSNLHFIVSPNGVPVSMDFTAGATSAAVAAAQINGAMGPDVEALAEGQTGFQYVTVRYVGPSPFAGTLLLPTASNPAAAVLGLITGATAYARSSSARDVALLIGQSLPSVAASSDVVPITNGANLLLRTEVTDPSMAVIYKARGTGAVVPGIGNTLTLTDASGDFITKGLVAGDKLVFRDGVNLNTMWSVTAVTDQTVDALGLAPATAGSAEYEIGPNLAIVVGDVLEVPTGMQNGTYTIVAVGPRTLSVPFELELQTTLPGFQTPIFGPRFFTGNIGEERLRLASRSTGPASSIAVTGPGAALFFIAGTAVATGTTPWVRLPAVVPSLAAGDVLEDYQTTYNIPTDSFPLQSVQGDVIGLQPVAVNLGRVFALTPDSLVPFAFLRSKAYEDFITMSARLILWGSLAVNQPAFMRELQRLVNIVLFEAAPAPDQVGAAFQETEQLVEALVNTASPSSTLLFALEEFIVQPVDQVDALIRSYSEKGGQRAIDILLQGRFSSFFGLDIDGISYAGALLSQMRAVARNDLVVRKIDRKVSTTSGVQSSSESPDYEYDVSNIEQAPLLDVPNEFERVPSTRNDPTNS